ncbi:MAG: phosphatase PAP2 family protein [Alkalibacterium sp.]|nr:phosphatase PAP2 family protein [Psychroflexus sp.]MDN6327382.1 phosphatase PAP2 family protein [Alkalibacterium sp.]
MKASFQKFDEDLFLLLNTLTSDISDQFWIVMTKPLFWSPLFLLIFILFFMAFKRRTAVIYSMGLITSFWGVYAVSYVVKHIVQRPRPLLNENLIAHMNILYEPTGFSFFSGHASTSMAAATFFYLIFHDKSKWAKLMFLFPLLFSLSRIFVGVHYPSDIFVGGVIGFLFGGMCFFVFRKINDKYFLQKPFA